MARTDPRPHYGQRRRERVDGYIDIWAPQHPLARKDGYVLEHRKVAWDAGLFSDTELQIHHRNGDKADNRLLNLEVITIVEHPQRHRLSGWALQNATKTHCKRGHELVEGNLYSYGGNRVCRRCAIERASEYKRRKRQERQER